MSLGFARNSIATAALLDRESQGTGMQRSEYYRRQSELCLQLALLKADLHADLRVTLWLLALARDLRAKADAADNPPTGAPCHVAFMVGPRRPPVCGEGLQ
jgi:hypothetical protein